MKVGDLVRLKKHCRNGGKYALVIGVYPIAADIQYLDASTGHKVAYALKSNLELISEGG